MVVKMLELNERKLYELFQNNKTPTSQQALLSTLYPFFATDILSKDPSTPMKNELLMAAGNCKHASDAILAEYLRRKKDS